MINTVIKFEFLVGIETNVNTFCDKFHLKTKKDFPTSLKMGMSLSFPKLILYKKQHPIILQCTYYCFTNVTLAGDNPFTLAFI